MNMESWVSCHIVVVFCPRGEMGTLRLSLMAELLEG